MGNNEKIKSMMKECGISYDEEQFIYESDNSISYVVPDMYTGSTMTYSIDEFGCLKLTVDNDSPEQAGGYEEEYLYVNGEQINISRLTDWFAYVVQDSKVYVCEIDRDLHGGATVYVTRRKPNNEFDVIYQGSISYDEYRELNHASVKTLIESKIA